MDDETKRLRSTLAKYVVSVTHDGKTQAVVTPTSNEAPNDSAHRHCSFCSKDQSEVAKLIAGPTTYICNECVTLCNEILAEIDAERAQQSAIQNIQCALCGEFTDFVLGARAVREHVLCPTCIWHVCWVGKRD